MPRPLPDDTFPLVVVSNRLPVAFREDDAGHRVAMLSPGGLVAALAPALAGHGVAWVGWDGTNDGGEEALLVEDFTLYPVALSQKMVEDHYEGFSNSTVWPLFHDVGVLPEYCSPWWEGYRVVNEMFATRVASITAPGATVWIHDYQMMLLPALIRTLRPDVTIGYFHHIPFPDGAGLQPLPQHLEVLQGLAGADVLGFQRDSDAANFQDALRLEGVDATGGNLPQVRVYPISVNTQAVSTAAAAPEVQRRATELRREWGSPDTVFLGVDRLDYTKGIPERLEAYEKLLSDGLVSAEDAVFVQVGSPSRENVDAYQALSESIDSLVSRINHAYPGTARAAIVYVAENLSREEMLALFVAADVMVVTSLADGMNLVAKEFVACRQDDSGVLVLSKNTGAADHMAQALLVDPYDIDDIAGAMGRAMVMPPSEVAHRMGILRADVTEHDVDSWATTILADLALIQAHSPR